MYMGRTHNPSSANGPKYTRQAFLASQLQREHCVCLQCGRQAYYNRIVFDAILCVPGRTGPEQKVDDTGHGFVHRVIERSWVAGPLVMKKAWNQLDNVPLD